MTTPTTHCKHDESGHSGTRLGDYSTSALLSGHFPVGFLSNNLCGVSFNNDAEFQDWLDDFFTSKPADFFKCGIENLPERWVAVVNNGGDYIID
jgi:hypothetical protein